eukprot:478978-Rhodomonas_salina.3
MGAIRLASARTLRPSPACSTSGPRSLPGMCLALCGTDCVSAGTSARRLILTASQDCTLCLWTLEGKKMGTFGEVIFASGALARVAKTRAWY